MRPLLQAANTRSKHFWIGDEHAAFIDVSCGLCITGVMDNEGDMAPGRECGGCTVCCIEPAIPGHGLDKPAGVVCVNCTGAGCSIYTARPAPCREFFCLWRRAPFVGEAWRPDQSGVLIAPSPLTGGTPSGISVVFIVAVWAHDLMTKPAFAELVAAFVGRGIGVYLNLPGAPDEPARESRLHDWVRNAIERGDVLGVMVGIEDCYRQTMALAVSAQP